MCIAQFASIATISFLLASFAGLGCSGRKPRAVEITCGPQQEKGTDGKCATKAAGGVGGGSSTNGGTEPTEPEYIGGGPGGEPTEPSEPTESTEETLPGAGIGSSTTTLLGGTDLGPGEPTLTNGGGGAGGSGNGPHPTSGGLNGSGNGAGNGGGGGGSNGNGTVPTTLASNGPTTTTLPLPVVATPLAPEATTFATDAPQRASDGAPDVKLKLVTEASGDMSLRLALSHTDEVTDLDFEAPRRAIALRTATLDATSTAAAGLAVDPFGVLLTVIFKFRQLDCRVTAAEATLTESVYKPECK